MVASSLKWHGGKSPIASWIISKFKKHTHYVEPYCGALHVLTAKPFEGISEVANDLDGRLLTFFRVLSCREKFAEFVRVVSLLPVSQALFAYSRHDLTPGPYSYLTDVEKAAAFFVVNRQSMAGRMKEFGPLSKSRTRRGMNEQVSAWLSAVEGLPEFAERLRRVVLYNEPALRIIDREDSSHTLFYCDPPYLHGTRATTGEYEHEMSMYDHANLLSILKVCKGQVFLSGYRSALYDAELSDWIRHDLPVANHAASGDVKRQMVECLWEKPC